MSLISDGLIYPRNLGIEIRSKQEIVATAPSSTTLSVAITPVAEDRLVLIPKGDDNGSAIAERQIGVYPDAPSGGNISNIIVECGGASGGDIAADVFEIANLKSVNHYSFTGSTAGTVTISSVDPDKSFLIPLGEPVNNVSASQKLHAYLELTNATTVTVTPITGTLTQHFSVVELYQ